MTWLGGVGLLTCCQAGFWEPGSVLTPTSFLSSLRNKFLKAKTERSSRRNSVSRRPSDLNLNFSFSLLAKLMAFILEPQHPFFPEAPAYWSTLKILDLLATIIM
jgi:hypothetical protein